MSLVQIAARRKSTLSPQAAARACANERIHYLDNLRALAMLLGVFFPAALAYAYPTQIGWLATDPESSVLVDASFCFIHLFRMGLFFLISGYFAKLLIVRRGLKSFVWNRTVRIVFPFILFYPVLLVLLIAVIVFAMSFLSHPLGLIGAIVKASRENPQASWNRSWNTMHLWFLYYLALLAAVTVVLSRFRGPRFERLFHRPWLLVLAPL